MAILAELFTFHIDSLSIGKALSHLVFGQALIHSVIGLAHTANDESVFCDEKVGLLLGRIDDLALQWRSRLEARETLTKETLSRKEMGISFFTSILSLPKKP